MKTTSMIVSGVLTLLIFVSMLMLPVSAAEKGKSAVVSFELSGPRNCESDSSPIDVGWSGTAVQVGDKDIVVTAVGRLYCTGANITHAFLVCSSDGALVNNASGAPAAGIVVQNYDDSEDGTFEYAYLDKGDYITLMAGGTYYFCSDHYGPTDKFYDSVKIQSTDDVNFIGSVRLNADNLWDFTPGENIDFFPIDFQYYVAGEELEEPTAAPTEKPTQVPETKSTEQPADAAIDEPTTAPADTETTDTASDTGSALPWIIGGCVAAALIVAIILVAANKKKKAK